MKAQRISRTAAGAWCRPSSGYDADNALEIDPNDYIEVAGVSGELPDSDAKWPKGAPLANYVKVGSKVLKKKGSSDS